MMEFTATSADGTELFGRHWPVDAPAAVMALVHGFGEHCGRYEHMAAYLNANGIAVVALDLRGHGKSAGKRGVIKSYDDFRDDLDALLLKTRALYPGVSLIVYGHSMGGAVILDFGTRTPGSLPLIASAPLLGLTEPIPGPLRALAKLLGKLLPSGVLTQPIDETKISNLPEEQRHYAEDVLHHGKLSFRLMEGMVATGETIQSLAAGWNRPLLLLHSKADQLTSFESSADFAEVAKQVEFHPFETSQHEMHNDAPRSRVYALMTDFILKHAKAETT